jgi:hypothetical protein
VRLHRPNVLGESLDALKPSAFLSTRPTSAYPGHYSRLSLLGPSYLSELTAGCLLSKREPSIGYSVPKVHWFVTLGRHFTPETLWSEVIHAGTG